MRTRRTITMAGRAGIAAVGVGAVLAVGTGTAGATTALPATQVQRTVIPQLVERAIIIVGGLPLRELAFLSPQPIPPGIVQFPPNPARFLFPGSGGTT